MYDRLNKISFDGVVFDIPPGYVIEMIEVLQNRMKKVEDVSLPGLLDSLAYFSGEIAESTSVSTSGRTRANVLIFAFQMSILVRFLYPVMEQLYQVAKQIKISAEQDVKELPEMLWCDDEEEKESDE